MGVEDMRETLRRVGVLRETAKGMSGSVAHDGVDVAELAEMLDLIAGVLALHAKQLRWLETHMGLDEGQSCTVRPTDSPS